MLGVHHLCTSDTSLVICFELVFGHKIDARVCAIHFSHEIFVWTSGTGHFQFFLVTMAKKKLVVDKVANNQPNRVVQSVGRVTCSQSVQNPNVAPEQNKDDQESKDAESEDSKHGDIEEPDGRGTETDSQNANTQEEEKVENCPKPNEAVAPEKSEEGTESATASEESQLATQASDDAKDENESAQTKAGPDTNVNQEQKEDDQDEDTSKAVETRTGKDPASPKNNKEHTTAEPKSSAEQEEAAAQERAKPLPQEGGGAQEDGAQEDVETKAKDSTPPAPTAPAEKHTEEATAQDRAEPEPLEGAGAPRTKKASDTANRQEETGQKTKISQSSAGTLNSDPPTFMTNDNFECPNDVLKKIVADESNLEKTQKKNFTQHRS